MIRGMIAIVLCSAGLCAQAIRINEVLADPVSGNQIVELTNIGPNMINTNQTQLCIQFMYAPVPSKVLAPGTFVRVHLGVTGTNTANDLFTGTMLPMPAASADSVSLYKAGGGFTFFTNPANMLDFVQWGDESQPRADIAVAAGIWPSESEYTSAAGFGLSLAWDGSGETAADWFTDLSPTLGAANKSPTSAVTVVGSGCSAGPAPTLSAVSVPALGNLDFQIVAQTGQRNSPALLYVGLGTTSVPILQVCTFHVNTVPLSLQILLSTSPVGSVTLPVVVTDPAFVGLGVGFQLLVANGGGGVPKYDMTNGLQITW